MANNTNTQLRENPVLQRMPKTQLEWTRYTNELVKWVVDIGATGQLTSDRIMPQSLLANMGTVQTTLPVTSTDAGATATVSVAAHTLSRTSGDVSYNAGSVTGLSYSTKYYIYADDKNFAGGAVTYMATTSKSDIVGDLGRYFVSEVTTPAAAAADNTGGVGAGFAVLEGDLTTSGLPSASATGKGIVELATGAETNTGTDTTRAVTPDALDDWTGSAQVTTLGTIATGTWNADVVAEAYLPNATDAAEGVVELATIAEVDTGTDTARVVTPAGLAGSALQTSVDAIATSSPAYTPTNDATDRSWDANAAVTGTGIDVAAAGPANVALLSDHDALVAVVQELSDVVATLVTDLQTKNVLG